MKILELETGTEADWNINDVDGKKHGKVWWICHVRFQLGLPEDISK